MNGTATAPCPLCGHGRLARGVTVITLTRGEATIVTRGVPADVCDACGEALLEEAVTKLLHDQADAAIARGVRYQVSEFTPAKVA